jgi:type II secretory pathway component GspD/PulD (secretin)
VIGSTQAKGEEAMPIVRVRKAGKAAGWLAVGTPVILVLGIWAAKANLLTGPQPSPQAATPAAESAKPRRVTINGRDLDVRVVLRSLARQIGSQLALDPAVHGKLSIDAREADFKDLMENLCTALRCEWKLERKPALTLSVTRQSGT